MHFRSFNKIQMEIHTLTDIGVEGYFFCVVEPQLTTKSLKNTQNKRNGVESLTSIGIFSIFIVGNFDCVPCLH